MNLVIITFILLTFVVLGVGLIFMASNNQKFNLKYSNKLMSLRVIFQAIAILMLAIIYFLNKK